MVIIIFITLLILGIAFYQAIQGCFSAMIMAILTVLTSVVALNYYEPLGGLLAGRLGAAADPSALLVMFVIPLFLLRILFDRLIGGNVVLGMWPDRIGGGVFGIITAMIMTGMFMIIFQLLPMPASIIGWQPYNSGLGVEDGGPPRWASRFTLATAKHLSDGPLRPIMSGGNKFSAVHDDLMLESFCLRNRLKGARASTPDDAIEITGAYIVQLPDDDYLAKLPAVDRARLKKEIPLIQDPTPEYPLLSQAEKDGTKILLIRVSIDESARNEDDNWWRLPATHFRMVCESGRSFYPVGYLTYSGKWQVNTSVSDKLITQIGDITVARPWLAKGGPSRLAVDWLYRIPSDQKPQYIVFRRTAKVTMPPVTKKGLPKAIEKDKKGKSVQIALSVKPVLGETKLLPFGTGRRLFNPKVVKVRGQLPDGIRVRLKEDPRPEAIKQIRITDGRLQKALIDGLVADLFRSKKRGARNVTGLFVPGRDTVLMHVQCKIDREFRDASIIKNLKPTLLLNTGRSVSHKGAYIFYNVGGKKQVYFYYDSQASRSRINSEFSQKFRDNLAETERFGVIFSVPVLKNVAVVGVTFGVGPNYKFYTVKPLECGRRW